MRTISIVILSWVVSSRRVVALNFCRSFRKLVSFEGLGGFQRQHSFRHPEVNRCLGGRRTCSDFATKPLEEKKKTSADIVRDGGIALCLIWRPLR